jgi:hypothetical protein
MGQPRPASAASRPRLAADRGQAAVDRDDCAGEVLPGSRGQEKAQRQPCHQARRSGLAAPCPQIAARVCGSSRANAIILLSNGPGAIALTVIDSLPVCPPAGWSGSALRDTRPGRDDCSRPGTGCGCRGQAVDYAPYVLGGRPAAHLTEAHRAVSGLVFPTHRYVLPRPGQPPWARTDHRRRLQRRHCRWHRLTADCAPGSRETAQATPHRGRRRGPSRRPSRTSVVKTTYCSKATLMQSPVTSAASRAER